MSSNMNNMNNMYGGFGNQVPPYRERLRVKLTSEERNYFSSLYDIADKSRQGRLIGKEAAEFLKKSGLTKDELKKIWLISAQTDTQFLEKDEFYIALRLVALAQNNMDSSEESIRINHPLPPLPRFDLKNYNSSSSSQSNKNSLQQSVSSSQEEPSKDNYSISELELQKYTQLFNKNKDMEDKISINRASQMWKIGGVPSDMLKKILSIVPIADKTCFAFNEFQVIFHLIYKSWQSEVPPFLPESLKKILQPRSQSESRPNNKDFNFGMNIGSSANQNRPVEPEPPRTQNPQVDMESLLMQEFNVPQNEYKPEPERKPESFLVPYSQTNVSAEGNYQPNQSHSQQEVSALSKSQQVPSDQLGNFSHNINDKFGEVQVNAEKQNQFLNQALEDETSVLNSLTEEIERVNRSIKMVEEKNRQVRDQITEVRRKINMEKDNLSKAVTSLGNKTRELMESQEELLKVKENHFNVQLEQNSNRAGYNRGRQEKTTAGYHNQHNNFSQDFPSVTKTEQPNRTDNKPGDLNFVNFSQQSQGFKPNNQMASPRSYNMPTTGLPNSSHPTGLDNRSTGNFDNKPQVSDDFNFNRSFDVAADKRKETFEGKFRVQTGQKENLPDKRGGVGYPTFDANPTYQHSGENGDKSETNNFNLDSQKEQGTKNIDADFDFDGFGADFNHAGGFKDFAEKKGEDMFKNTNEIGQDNWEF